MTSDLEISGEEVKVLLKSIIRRSRLNSFDDDFIHWVLDKNADLRHLYSDGIVWYADIKGGKGTSYTAEIYKATSGIFFGLYDSKGRGLDNKVLTISSIFFPFTGLFKAEARYLKTIMEIVLEKGKDEKDKVESEVRLKVQLKQKNAVKDITAREIHL